MPHFTKWSDANVCAPLLAASAQDFQGRNFHCRSKRANAFSIFLTYSDQVKLWQQGSHVHSQQRWSCNAGKCKRFSASFSPKMRLKLAPRHSRASTALLDVCFTDARTFSQHCTVGSSSPTCALDRHELPVQQVFMHILGWHHIGIPGKGSRK